MECLDKQLQFNIMNIINDVSSSKSFIHRKNQAHKTLGTYRKKLYQLLRSAIFFLRQVKYSTAQFLLASEIAKGESLMYIIRASRKLPDGTVIYARDYGKRGFPIWIGPGPEPESTKHVYY